MTGDLPIVPLWGEDRSSSTSNSDLKADFYVVLCEGVLWHKVAAGIINAMAGRVQESRPRDCGIKEVASGTGSMVGPLLHFIIFFNQKNSSEVVTNRGRIDNQAKINSFSYEKGGEVVERHPRSFAALCLWPQDDSS